MHFIFVSHFAVYGREVYLIKKPNRNDFTILLTFCQTQCIQLPKCLSRPYKRTYELIMAKDQLYSMRMLWSAQVINCSLLCLPVGIKIQSEQTDICHKAMVTNPFIK